MTASNCKRLLQEFSQLKKQRKDLKLLICLTGPNTAFTTLVASPQTMSRLANDSLAYLKKFNLDGIDIDWEFPTWSPDGHKTDRARFPLLLKTLREKYGSDFLITLAVSGPPTITRVAYDVPSFNRYVDLVQVMNYDYHIYSKFRPFVGFNAPLRRLKGELGAIGEMNSVPLTSSPQSAMFASDSAFRKQPWPLLRNWGCGTTRR
ncbi:glycosyl hydrolase, family 18 [Ancylostoma duodenale]|uniref:Glycosyl hydrolase, family 18 n=1 Tax=Ancylostoma duodenale TaxID=51022 RepID=A0A0C2F491_9BILA|nr:glycosyl hydrolase, family 18 [Ancylostoma duodenale]